MQNVDVYTAQRVSVVLNANQPINNYWIRAPPTGGSPTNNPNCMSSPPLMIRIALICDIVNASLTLAILRYKGARAVEPTTVNPGGPKLLDTQMHVSFSDCFKPSGSHNFLLAHCG